jgi:hypothetical protein
MKPTPTKKTELRYARALRNVARFSGQLVLMHVEGSTLTNVPGLERAVREYMAAITPWAQRRATEMVSAVNLTNEKYWVSAAKAAGRALRLEFAEAPTGQVARQLVAEQVGLITSLPLDAAQRATARSGGCGKRLPRERGGAHVGRDYGRDGEPCHAYRTHRGVQGEQRAQSGA